MKSNVWVALLIATVSTVFSCNKKEQTCNLGKMFTTDGSNTTRPTIYSYYADGRIQKVVYPTLNKDSIAYTADSVFVWTRDNKDSLVAYLAATLTNGQNISIGTKTYYNYLGAITGTETITAQYNTAGQLDSKTTNSGNGLQANTFNFANGNRTTGKHYSGSTHDVDYLFFYGTAENKTGVDFFELSYQPLFGKTDNNLLDSIYLIQLPAKDTIRVQFAHTLDRNGYLSKTVRTYLTPVSGMDTKYVTYQYFNCSK